MTPAGRDDGSGRRRGVRRRPSFELEINGSMRQIPSSPSTTSSRSTLDSEHEGSEEDGVRVTACQQPSPLGGGRSSIPSKTALVLGGKHAGPGGGGGAGAHISAQEWGNMALLVLLYAMQGIPLGLTMGAMPFLLQSKLSMTQMGLFSMSGYPYSFKLLWSPIVDSVYSSAFGRRKSWIVPVQLASALLLIFRADWIQAQYEAGAVGPLTVLFFFFVLLAATQDIAVDGWALTLLPPHHIEYASTCQTLGMNTGYFMSFTIFLALSNPAFCNTYIRTSWAGAALGLQPQDAPIVSLRSYVAFWGCAFTLITLAVALFKQETAHYSEGASRREWRARQAAVRAREARHDARRAEAGTAGPTRRAAGAKDGSSGGGGGGSNDVSEWAHRRAEIVTAYVKLWEVVCLPAIWYLSFLLVTYRLGVLPTESAASLKLLDKGVAKEALAALVLVQFPVELVSAVIAGRWASSHSPYQPFMVGYFVRLLMAALLTALTHAFPPGASSFLEHKLFFGALSALGLVTSFSSTLMFTALGSFFNRISDPGMGGAYLTLLNTIANMGVILPKTPLFAAMDWLTLSSCRDVGGAPVHGLACPKKIRLLAGSSACTDAGHTCAMVADGFYVVSYVSLALGLLLGCAYMRVLPRLIALPLNRWRAKHAV